MCITSKEDKTQEIHPFSIMLILSYSSHLWAIYSHQLTQLGNVDTTQNGPDPARRTLQKLNSFHFKSRIKHNHTHTHHVIQGQNSQHVSECVLLCCSWWLVRWPWELNTLQLNKTCVNRQNTSNFREHLQNLTAVVLQILKDQIEKHAVSVKIWKFLTVSLFCDKLFCYSSVVLEITKNS